MSERVAVIGGEGNMGRLTVDLFQRLGYETISSDTRQPETPTAMEAIRESRIVFFSVLPIEEIPRILEAADGIIRPDHVILDNTSLKNPLQEALKRLSQRGVSICSTHPLCKHDQPLYGQGVLLMDVGPNPAEARQLAEKLYRSSGMITVPLSFETHDETMVILQLLPHLIMRAVAEVLSRNGIDLNTMERIFPANFQLFNLSMWRTIVQDSRISATIIKHLLDQPTGLKLAKQLYQAIEKLTEHPETEEQLAKRFRGSATRLNTANLASRMNEVTTTVLERLANLRAQSIKVICRQDKPGVLRRVGQAFEEAGINMTAFDSHKLGDDVIFTIGVDQATSSPDQIKAVTTLLKQQGFEFETLPAEN